MRLDGTVGGFGVGLLEFGFWICCLWPWRCPPRSLGKQDRDILEGLDVVLALREPPMGDCGVLGVEIEV